MPRPIQFLSQASTHQALAPDFGETKEPSSRSFAAPSFLKRQTWTQVTRSQGAARMWLHRHSKCQWRICYGALTHRVELDGNLMNFFEFQPELASFSQG